MDMTIAVEDTMIITGTIIMTTGKIEATVMIMTTGKRRWIAELIMTMMIEEDEGMTNVTVKVDTMMIMIDQDH